MGKSQVAEKQKTIAVETQVVSDEPTCQHHWIIESPRGALSAGHCKICGEEREFRNSTSDYVWDDDSGNSYSPWRGVRSTPKAPDDDEMAASARTGTHTLAV